MSVLAQTMTQESFTAPDNSFQYLETSVLRLMLADEVAVTGEVEKAGVQLENALTNISEKDLKTPGSRDLVSLATKIRDQIADSDRKSAVESLLIYRKKSDEVIEAKYKGPLETRVAVADYLAVMGGFGALGFIALALYRRRLSAREITLEHEQVLKTSMDIDAIRREFSAERERTTSLQQRLVEVGKLMKTKDADLDDAVRRLASFEAKRKSQEARIQAIDLKRETAEAEVLTTRSELRTLENKMSTVAAGNRELSKSYEVLKGQMDVALSRLTEATALARAREEALLSELAVFKAGAFAREKGLSEDLDQALSELRANKISAKFRESTLTSDLSNLRTECAKIKNDFASEMTVIEWTNAKLNTQVRELQDEINRLKAEQVAEARRFTDQLARAHG
jgi:hypothetical protein